MRELVRHWLVRRFTPGELRTLGPSVDSIVQQLSASDLALLRSLWRGHAHRARRHGAEALLRQVLDPGRPLPLLWCLTGGLGGAALDGGGPAHSDENYHDEEAEGCRSKSIIVDKLGPWFKNDTLWQQAKVSSMEGAQEGMRSVVRQLVEPLLRRQLSEGASEGVRRGVQEGMQEGVLAATQDGVRQGVEAGLRALQPGDLPERPLGDQAVWKKAWSAVTCEDCDDVVEEGRSSEPPPPKEGQREQRREQRRERKAGRAKQKPPLLCTAKQRSGAPCTRRADYYLRSRNGAAINLVRQRSLVWPLTPLLAPGWWKARRGYVPLCRQHRNHLLQQLRLQHPLLYAQVFALGASGGAFGASGGAGAA